MLGHSFPERKMSSMTHANRALVRWLAFMQICNSCAALVREETLEENVKRQKRKKKVPNINDLSNYRIKDKLSVLFFLFFVQAN